MSERFYVNWPLVPGLVELEGPEAHHLAGVSRVRPGDAVCLFNGDGREYPARVLSVARRSVTLQVAAGTAAARELPFPVEVAAPLPKGDRAQFLLEKLTELGVTSFVPLHTRRSVVHPQGVKLAKLERYVIEASKQCGRNVLLQVHPLADWETYCCRDNRAGLRILAHPGKEQGTSSAASIPAGSAMGAGQVEAKLLSLVASLSASGVCMAVGPEGGFTDDEVAAGIGAGWRPVDLGPRILRIETAALALAAVVSMAALDSSQEP